MQGGLIALPAARDQRLGRFEDEGCPGMGRVENVHPGATWSVVCRRWAGESSFLGHLARNSALAQTYRTPCRPDQSQAARHPLGGGDTEKERRLNHEQPLAYLTQETVQWLGGSKLSQNE